MELRHFQWLWTTPNPHFKVTRSFDAKIFSPSSSQTTLVFPYQACHPSIYRLEFLSIYHICFHNSLPLQVFQTIFEIFNDVEYSDLEHRLEVTHPVNLCMIYPSLKFTNLGLSFCHWHYGSISIHFHTDSCNKLCRVTWCVTVIQGHQNW